MDILVAMEGETDDIPFLIRRAFYIFKSDNTVMRGCHANYNTEFILVNLQGICRVKTDNGIGSIKGIFLMNEVRMCIYLP